MVELRHRNLRDVDWLLFLTPIALTVLGCIGIHSTAPNQEFKKQLVALGIGIAVAIAVMLTDYRKIVMNIAPFLYAGTMVLLVCVLFFGKEVNHNKAWLNVGVSIQPSEFAKIATILMLTRFMSQVRGPLKLKDIILMTAIVIPPIILIQMEHDTGTMLTFGSIIAVFYILGGMRKLLLIAAALAVVAGLIAVYPHLKEYQRQRVMAVWEPERVDPKGYAYQTIQSVVAVGSGGTLGKGIGNGTQGKLGFLPYAWTDFIGAVIAEEMGFVGIMLMMVLYLAFIWRLIHVALGSRDRAGALMIMGLVSLIGFHILCNLGMVVGLMPIMGIPLPLMSSGGTSVISMFIGVGLALSVRFRRFVN
ncbi:MAG TPA: FtsW/RodA/SpoVE family cell cycle protein [Blastocatellia bacterium]|nr:FtsW/RodA/SpoVE family cell cycle protein [Blastocatellia bacterium]